MIASFTIQKIEVRDPVTGAVATDDWAATDGP